jgi:hypothetical protein
VAALENEDREAEPEDQQIMTQRAETLVLAPGTCRYCGCTETTPCSLLIRDGDYSIAVQVNPLSLDFARPLPPGEELMHCFWIDPGKSLCSNPRCVAQVPMEELIGMGYTVDYLIGELAKAAGR